MAQQLTERLIRWKKKLEREIDEEEALSVIRKLHHVPITVKLLQDTGIGKLINQLGKQDGRIGEKAAMVLKKWKETVSASQSAPDATPKSSNKHVKNAYTNSEHSASSKQKHTNGHVALHTSSIEHPSKKMKYSESSTNISKKQSRPLKNTVPETGKNSSKYDRFDDSFYDPADTEAYEPQPPKYTSKYNRFEDALSQGAEPYSPEHPEIASNSVYNNLSNVEYKPTPISSTNGLKEYKKSKSSSEKSYIKPDRKHHESEKPLDKHQRHGEKRKRSDSNHALKTKCSSSPKHEVVKQNVEHKSKNALNGVPKLQKTPSASKMSKEHVQSTGDHKSMKNHKSGTAKKVKVSTAEEFTASEGSFEACLGFNDIITPKKKKPAITKPSKGKGSPVRSSMPAEKFKTPKVEVVSSSKKPSSREEASGAGRNNHLIEHNMPLELKEMPKDCPVKIDISATLPEIQPNYKPLPQIDLDRLVQKKKCLSNEEAIMFTSSKRDRTAVYSGRRNCFTTEVPSLFDLCIRLLIEHIDCLDYFGGVPYYLIKPVLERCNPHQLYQLEDCNPYLLEDTNELWERHCQRDFRTHKPDEGETWRELYLRVYDEKEKKLKYITANISASMSKSNPVRQVKLAYVDSVVKPPRDVARKQAKNGTALPVNHTMKSGPPSKATPRPTTPVLNAVNAKSSASTPAAASKKPKMAPLMAKTLKTLKHVYRR